MKKRLLTDIKFLVPEIIIAGMLCVCPAAKTAPVNVPNSQSEMSRNTENTETIQSKIATSESQKASAQTTNVAGQNKTNIEFPSGKNSVVLQDKIKKPKTHKVYFLQLNKDKVLYVQLSSPNDTLGFEVFDPNGRSIGTPGDEDWDWEDQVSMSGTYRIDVSAKKGIGSYKLKVMLKNKLRQ